MIKPWPKLSSTILGHYRIFRLRQDETVSPRTGRGHTFYVLEATDWVNVIPLTADSEVVMVRQYRHGTGTVTLELPAGMADHDGETAAAAAARELREETGYVAREIIHLGSVEPNPAFLNNRCHTFLAVDAAPVHVPSFDGGEDILVERVSLADIPAMITSGLITHSLTICAFYYFEHSGHSRET
jgi:8-oxo-dGTP pyrophosphatase MutT (NUDIX family)